MLNFGSQVLIRLGKDKNGNPVDMSGRRFINSLEVHKDPSISVRGGRSIVMTTPGKVCPLQKVHIKEAPIYIDGSSKANGQLDGSPIFAGEATIGLPLLDIIDIGGAEGNLSKVLDRNYNEVVTDDVGDLVYAIYSTSANDGDYITDLNAQVSFAIIKDGEFREHILPAGEYFLEPKLVYTFGYARYNNLSVGGNDSAGVSSGAGGGSYEEIFEAIMREAKDLTSYARFQFNGETGLDQSLGYVINFYISEDGSTVPVFEVLNDIEGIVTPVGTTVTTDMLNIRAIPGLGYMSNIFFYVNGVKVRNDKVEVTKVGKLFKITFDNRSLETVAYTLGELDSVEVQYVVPWEPVIIPGVEQFGISYMNNSLSKDVMATVKTVTNANLRGTVVWRDISGKEVERVNFDVASGPVATLVKLGTTTDLNIADYPEVSIQVETIYNDGTSIEEML